ncbi:ABC transporter ATP-binding protein [Sphingomonas sp. UYP23]
MDGLGNSNIATLRNCYKQLGSTLAVDDLTLSIPAGRVTALLGPNGAGKSTSIALLTGQLAPDRGTASLFGKDPRQPSARASLGVMLQMAGLPSQLTVVEQIKLFSGYYPLPRPLGETIDLAGLHGLESRRCRALSGGQQRRLQFALAICGRPRLLVLDEPTTGLDTDSRRLFWNVVRSEVADGTAVLLTTHLLEEADALADHIVVLGNGHVQAECTPAALKARVKGSTIRCRTVLPETTILTMPGVQRCIRDGGRTAIVTTSAPKTLRSLLRLDDGVQDIAVSGATLDAAFTSLVAPQALEKAA